MRQRKENSGGVGQGLGRRGHGRREKKRDQEAAGPHNPSVWKHLAVSEPKGLDPKRHCGLLFQPQAVLPNLLLSEGRGFYLFIQGYNRSG